MLVYTGLFGGYDNLRPTSHADVGHYLYTEEPLSIRGWTTCQVERHFENAAKDNRYRKLQPHLLFPGETALYHDASMSLRVHPSEILSWMVKQTEPGADLYALGHPLRNTLPMEIELVRRRGMEDEGMLDSVAERYRDVPQDKVGIEARLFIATPSAEPLFRVWWDEVLNHSHRDQISYHYALHLSGINVATVPLKKARFLFDLYPHVKPQPKGAK